MQYFWLNKKNENKKIIVFFNGWGMNEGVVEHLEYEDYDVLILFDYRNLDFNFNLFDFKKYNEKYLICWSMGVYCSNLFKKYLNDFDKKIAINGTNRIIDDNYGIAEKIYKITIKLFNEESCEKFVLNMFNKKNNQNIKITRDLNDLKEELISIQKIILNLDDEIDFDKVIISNKDNVIPTKNQLNYWNKKSEFCKIKEINSSHYPFDNFKKWSEIFC